MDAFESLLSYLPNITEGNKEIIVEQVILVFYMQLSLYENLTKCVVKQNLTKFQNLKEFLLL